MELLSAEEMKARSVAEKMAREFAIFFAQMLPRILDAAQEKAARVLAEAEAGQEEAVTATALNVMAEEITTMVATLIRGAALKAARQMRVPAMERAGSLLQTLTLRVSEGEPTPPPGPTMDA